MNKHNFGQSLRYRFDNYMSRGPGALIAGLTLCSAIVVVVAGLVIGFCGIAPEGAESLGVGEGMWQSLMHALDSGAVGADSGWSLRLVMLLVTIGGIFILSTLIGVLSNSLSEKLEQLRRGRSVVIEAGHTVILGWSPKLFAVLDQLMIANQSRRKPLVVILAARDKQDMDQEIKERYGSDWKTRVVCRTGNPCLHGDLEIANVNQARSIVILSAEQSDDPDMETIRALMALRQFKDGAGEDLRVVAEMTDPARLAAAKVVAGSNTGFVLVGDSISRIAAQSCRQQGLSVVYQELLDFEGDELYFRSCDQLVGKTFRECLFAFRKASIIGVVDGSGQVKVNPALDTIIGEGWKLIGIAEDEDCFVSQPGMDAAIDDRAFAGAQGKTVQGPEHTVILSFNDRVPTIIRELDAYVAAGSTLTLVHDAGIAGTDLAGIGHNLANMSFKTLAGDTTDRAFLESLDLGSVHHLIIMSPLDAAGLAAAENRTILTLINIRDLAKKNGYGFSITSEILDLVDRELVEAMDVDDFIVSDQLVSQLIAQLSENPGLEPVFADLFDADGAEIYLKPASDFVRPGVELEFRAVLEAAARQSCVAIGYKIAALEREADFSYGVFMNPDKFSTCSFQADDRIIVIADN